MPEVNYSRRIQNSLKYCMRDRHFKFRDSDFSFIIYDPKNLRNERVNVDTLKLKIKNILKKVMHFGNVQVMENSRAGGLKDHLWIQRIIYEFSSPVAHQVRQTQERSHRGEEEGGRKSKETRGWYTGVQQKKDPDCSAGATSYPDIRKEQEKVKQI